MESSVLLHFDPLSSTQSRPGIVRQWNQGKENSDPAEVSISTFFNRPLSSYSNLNSNHGTSSSRKGRLIEFSISMDSSGEAEGEAIRDDESGDVLQVLNRSLLGDEHINSLHASHRTPLIDGSHDFDSCYSPPSRASLKQSGLLSPATPSTKLLGSYEHTHSPTQRLLATPTTVTRHNPRIVEHVQPSTPETVRPLRVLSRPLQHAPTIIDPSHANTNNHTFESVKEESNDQSPQQYFPLVANSDTPELLASGPAEPTAPPASANGKNVQTILEVPHDNKVHHRPSLDTSARESHRMSLDLNTTFDLHYIEASFDLIHDELSFLGTSAGSDESIVISQPVPNVFANPKPKAKAIQEVRSAPSSCETDLMDRGQGNSTSSLHTIEIPAATTIPLPPSPGLDDAFDSPPTWSPLRCKASQPVDVRPQSVSHLPNPAISVHAMAPSLRARNITEPANDPTSILPSIRSGTSSHLIRARSQLLNNSFAANKASTLSDEKDQKMMPILSSRALSSLARSDKRASLSRPGYPAPPSRLGPLSGQSRLALPPPRAPRISSGISSITRATRGVQNTGKPDAHEAVRSTPAISRVARNNTDSSSAADLSAIPDLPKRSTTATPLPASRIRSSTIPATPHTQHSSSMLPRSQTPIFTGARPRSQLATRNPVPIARSVVGDTQPVMARRLSRHASSLSIGSGTQASSSRIRP